MHFPALPPHHPRRATRGFTLVELMIAVSVVGVLSGVALPTFEGQLHKARRSDVLIAMLQVQSAQERFRSYHAGYGSAAEIGVPAVSAAGHYALQVTPDGSTGYEVLASATGAQARDTACRLMKLSAAAGSPSYASGADATFANPPEQNRKCWML